jgi:peptidoglycan lytic transglycosylase D
MKYRSIAILLLMSLAGLAFVTFRQVEGLRKEVQETRQAQQDSLQKVQSDINRRLDTAWSHILLSAYTMPESVLFCEPVPLERPRVREKVEFELFKFLKQRNNLVWWYRMEGRYFPLIEPMLAEVGAPDDLKYMVVLESLLDPRARSGKMAVGLWQFIRRTGNRYGLKETPWVDQRMDPWLSTDAAGRHVLDLYKVSAFKAQHHDWWLALAQYVCSPGTIATAIRHQGHQDYFSLILPRDAERYVPQLIALKIIFSNPHSYGLDRVEQFGPLPEVQDTTIELPKGGTVKDLADSAGISMDDFLLIDGQYRGTPLPPGSYAVKKLAPGSSAKLSAANQPVPATSPSFAARSPR